MMWSRLFRKEGSTVSTIAVNLLKVDSVAVVAATQSNRIFLRNDNNGNNGNATAAMWSSIGAGRSFSVVQAVQGSYFSSHGEEHFLSGRGGQLCAKKGFSTQPISYDSDASDEIGSESEEALAEIEEANKRCMGHLQIQKSSHGWGVFTSRPFKKGEVVVSSKPLHGDDASSTSTTSSISSKSTAHSIQIGWNTHLLMDLPARFINHSCDPCVYVGGLNQFGSYNFVALVDIGAGELHLHNTRNCFVEI